MVHQVYKESSFGSGKNNPVAVDEGQIVKTDSKNSRQEVVRSHSEPARSHNPIQTVTNPYALIDGTKIDTNKTAPRNISLNLNIERRSQNMENRTQPHSSHPAKSERNESSRGNNQCDNQPVNRTKHLGRSYSVDSDSIERYIDKNTGTLKRDISLPDEKIKKLIANSERRHSGTFVSSMTIPLHSTTQRKTTFSVVKSGGSSYKTPPHQQTGSQPHSNGRRGSVNSIKNRMETFIKKESSL